MALWLHLHKSNKGDRMKTLINLLTVLVCMFAFNTQALASVEMTDSELSEVTAGEDVQLQILALKDLINQNLVSGNKVDAKFMIAQLADISKRFGVTLEGINIEGVGYNGGFTMTIKNGLVAQNYELPSSIDSITIDSVKLGGGPSIGSVEFSNIQMQGHVSIEFHN